MERTIISLSYDPMRKKSVNLIVNGQIFKVDKTAELIGYLEENVVQPALSKEKNNTVSTLDCPGLTKKREDGNTTRQVDFAVQKLCRGFEVEIRDHFENGKNKTANKHLYFEIVARLENSKILEREEQKGFYFNYDKNKNKINFKKL